MSFIASNNLPGELAINSGNSYGWSVVHKFGRVENLGTSFVPVCFGQVYRTPQVASATQLRIKAGDGNDISSGTGARSVYIEGLNASGALTSETIDTNGTSASSNSTNSYIRLFRAYVATSGTYATQSAGSHSANIVIENAAGTEDWATINSTGFPESQTQIAAYSVPLNYTAYVDNLRITIESGATNKPADVVMFQRQNILDTAAPYQAMRVVAFFLELEGEYIGKGLLGSFPALTDIGFMAKAPSGTPDLSVAFDIFLKQD